MIKAEGADLFKVAEVVEPGEADEPTVRWWEPLLAWGLAMAVFLALLPHLLDWLNPVTGDEPFYLMTAISLLQDHDLDESNNYDGQDYWRFAPTCQEMRRPNWGLVGDPAIENLPGLLAPGLRNDCGDIGVPFLKELSTLPPHFSKGIQRAGSYTKHGLGLSFLIAPAYALGGRPLVVGLIAAMAALLGVNLWLLAFETTGRRGVAWLSWGLLLFSSPLLCYAFLIFPATPAALLVGYSWRRLRLSARAQQQARPDWQPNGPWRAVLIGLCIGFLPWLHSVYLSISAGLFLYWLAGGRVGRWRQNRRRGLTSLNLSQLFPAGWSPAALAGLFLPLLFLGGLFVTFYLYYYGAPLPNTQDHAGFAPLTEIPLSLAGLLFDQKYGLLIYGPLYLLAFAGLWQMAGRTPDALENAARRSDLAWMGVVALPYILVIASYNQWWGEWCPPARYLVPVLPLLAVPLSLALVELNGRFFRLVAALLSSLSLAVSIMFMYNPHLMYNWQTLKPAVSLSWLEANLPFMSGAGLGQLLPSYVSNLTINGGGANWLAALVWLALALATLLLLVGLGPLNRQKE